MNITQNLLRAELRDCPNGQIGRLTRDCPEAASAFTQILTRTHYDDVDAFYLLIDVIDALHTRTVEHDDEPDPDGHRHCCDSGLWKHR